MTIRKSEPPFLELGFYFGSRNEKEYFREFVLGLLKLGAMYSGKGHLYTGPQVSFKPFVAISDCLLIEGKITDDQEFFSYLMSEDCRLIELTMLNATGLDSELMESVTYNSITAKAAYNIGETHPLSIVTEGDWIEEKFEHQNYLGNRIYTRFKELIEINKPSYAAITIESELKCPTDLAIDPRSNAFQDFYVSSNYFSHSDFECIQNLFPGAYKETIGEGIYISSSSIFNPEGTNIDGEFAAWQSVEVAKLIAKDDHSN